MTDLPPYCRYMAFIEDQDQCLAGIGETPEAALEAFDFRKAAEYAIDHGFAEDVGDEADVDVCLAEVPRFEHNMGVDAQQIIDEMIDNNPELFPEDFDPPQLDAENNAEISRKIGALIDETLFKLRKQSNTWMLVNGAVVRRQRVCMCRDEQGWYWKRVGLPGA